MVDINEVVNVILEESEFLKFQSGARRPDLLLGFEKSIA